MAPIHNYLIVSVLGPNRPGMMSELSRTYDHYGCDLIHSQMNVLGQDLSAYFFLSGNWGAIAKLEAALPALEQRLSLSIQSRRTQELTPTQPLMTYSLQVIAVDRGGILNELFDLCQKETVFVEESCSYTYLNSTGTIMFNAQLKVHIPTNVHVATLRDVLMNYCDEHNCEGFLESLRS
jgi:glycine cleavage system transcriptional repressor